LSLFSPYYKFKKSLSKVVKKIFAFIQGCEKNGALGLSVKKKI